jgi:hypothetical protein
MRECSFLLLYVDSAHIVMPKGPGEEAIYRGGWKPRSKILDKHDFYSFGEKKVLENEITIEKH